MGKKWHKFKLLLDENLPPRASFPRLNSRHTVKHLVQDFKGSGMTDEEVYQLATEYKFLIVTLNEKDFYKKAAISKDTGVIAVSAGTTNEQIDKRLASLLANKTPKKLYGHFHAITSG